VLFEVDPTPATVENRACNGILVPPEVSRVGQPVPLSHYLSPEGIADLLANSFSRVFERRSPATPVGIREYLERIGSERVIVVPVPFASPRGTKLFLEVHYQHRERTITPEDIAEALVLAPMLGSALSSTKLVAENSDLLAESERAAEALRTSEALLRGLIDGLPGYAYQCDPEGDTIFTSAQLGTMLGVPQEHWREQPDELWGEHLHPDDRERVLAEWRRSVRDQRPHDSVYRMVDASGGSVWVRDRESIVRDPDGVVRSRIGIGFDITAEIEARRALEQSERRHRLLIEQIPAATYVRHPDGETLFISPQIESILGYQRKRWTSEPQFWSDYIHPEDRERVLAAYVDAITAGVEFEAEYRVITSNGETRWLVDRATVLSDEYGEPYLVQGVVYEVTDRKLSEHENARLLDQALTAVRERDEALALRDAVFENSPVGIALLDDELRYVRVNPALAALQEPDAIGRPFREVQPHLAAVCEPLLRRVLSTGEPLVTNEISGRTPTEPDHDSHFLTSMFPIGNQPGAPVGVGMIVLDVSERRRTEHALAESERHRQSVVASMLRSQDAERARIAVELHDDTIQVLTASMLSLDQLTRSLQNGDVTAAERSALTTREILGDATERTRRMTFDMRPQVLQARGLSAAISDTAERAATEGGFDVVVNTRLVRYQEMTETLVYRTVRELLANVRKHAQARQVRVTAIDRGHEVYGHVIDDGCGFDPASLLKGSQPGMHFGLDAAGERVRLAGGQFDITSAPGSGTTVSFTVPSVKLTNP
jgi:PAS domain S-box-containing protein